MAEAYVALGANLGNREANLRMALRGMTRMARVLTASALYETDAVTSDDAEQPNYYNAACSIETGLEPLPLLRFLQALEHEIGRRPAAEQWAPRPIDLDLLLYEDTVLDDGPLVLPHPRMAERPFVLVPLADIAGCVTHPVLGRTIKELANAAGNEGVRRIRDRGWDGVAGHEPGRVRL
ncbi:MAG: 2-amino-4-hydroxy-6-hydroxymethyldihydropteridine diphosphokinase [Dehalococcoidia bacterium]